MYRTVEFAITRIRFLSSTHQRKPESIRFPLLSKHSHSSEPKKQGTMAEDYINFISGHAVRKAMTQSEIQKATRADQTLQQLAKMICTNQ